MNRPIAEFAEAMAAVAAGSGLLTPLQGRLFGVLYLSPEPLSLDAIAAELGQSKSHVSVQIRGLVAWLLVRRVRVAGSRRDHYEAATDFQRALCEILERHFRASLRQVLAASDAAALALESPRSPKRAAAGRASARRVDAEARLARFRKRRLAALRGFVAAVAVGVESLVRGRGFAADALRGARPAQRLATARSRSARRRR